MMGIFYFFFTILTYLFIYIIYLIYYYFTSRYDEWDNRFFGISDREAEQVDPQHHFVLETVHMALEDAGIPKEKIAGTDTGVYIGIV